MSYSAEVVTSLTGDVDGRWGAFLFFVQWSRVGATSPVAHLESDYLGQADTEADARALVEALSLAQARSVLHALIAARDDRNPARRWWDAMRDPRPSDGGERS